MADARSIAQQLIVGFEKTLVNEVVGLNAREGEGELILFVVAGEGGIGKELRGGALPSAPDLRSRESHGRIVAGKAAVIGGQQIAALGLRDVGEVRLPGVRIEDRRAALVEPIDFLLAEEEDAAEDEFSDAVGISLGIGKGERGAPGSAEYLPALNAEVLADFLDVGDQVPGGVGFERRVGRALAAAALVEVHDAVLFGMEEAALFGIGAAAGTAVQKDHRLAGRDCRFPRSRSRGRVRPGAGPCCRARSEGRAR